MIFVSVSKKYSFQFGTTFSYIFKIRYYYVYPRHMWLGKHESAIDHHGFTLGLQHHHIEAYLAESAKGDDLYIVDQHTAHERVLYEETLEKLEQSSVEGQTLLFPAQLELDPDRLGIVGREEPGQTF